MGKSKLSWIDKNFERTVRQKYPYKSMYQITKELNKELEKIVYGADLNAKRKKR